jgi:DNA-binding NarL/FixJ family response regulator
MEKSVRILIADDHELVRHGMRTLFEREPQWTVCGEATTGREALTMAMELKPDLLVLDLALPEMNGIEATRHVRRALPSTAVLIVTIHDSDEVVREAIDAGAAGFVLKAEAGRTLADAVYSIVSHGEYFSERVRRAAGRDALDGEVVPSRRKFVLTSREREVLQLLAEGRANKEIATALGISPKTAETHRARIMSKLEFHSITELVRYAIKNRIIEA